MATNVGIVADEENLYGGSKDQTPTSTPMPLLWKVEKGNKQNPTSLSKVLGLEEIVSLKIWRASLAEVLGTAILVFAFDTIVISSIQTDTSTPNLVMSIIIAIIVTILKLATFPISGGHINPTITFAALFTGLISVSPAAMYIFAQCVGGVIGALALKAVINSNIERTYLLGGCFVTSVVMGPDGPMEIALKTGQALWLEMICTFVFLFASVLMAFDERQVKKLGRVTVCIIFGLVLGLLVFISMTVTATKGVWAQQLLEGPSLECAMGILGWAHYCLCGFRLYTKIIPHEHFHILEN